MEQHWLIRNGNTRLLVVALGWGADPRAIGHLTPDGYDVLCLYDYRTVEPVPAQTLARYPQRTLMAWSFGVRVAEAIFARGTFGAAVALCGTPRPVDDALGIPVRAFEATLRGLSAAGDLKFNRRTYGESYEALLGPGQAEQRPLGTRIAELESLYRLAQTPYTPALDWTRAVAGGRDLIFPPANQLRYWGDRAELIADMPHYPFADRDLILRYLGNE